MKVLMAIIIGYLFSCGLYLLLGRSLLKVIIGLSLISHASNLLLFLMGGLKKGAIPVIGETPSHTDPLVQALILTAIVISFGVTAFLLVVALRAHEEYGSDDLDDMREIKG